MKVKDLIEKLSEFDPELDVYVSVGCVNLAYIELANFVDLSVLSDDEVDCWSVSIFDSEELKEKTNRVVMIH